jgi:AraC-like DNA-binding protein
MQSELPTLFLLYDAPELEAALRSACATTYQVRVMADWSAHREALKRCTPDSVAVVDPYQPGTTPPELARRLSRLLLDFPSSPVIAVVKATPDRVPDLRHLNEWGVAEVLDVSEELSPAALTNRLEAVRNHRVRVVLNDALPKNLSTRARALITAAAEVVSSGGQTPELAERLQLTEQTFSRWCVKVGLPQPRRILDWLRLLLAADMLCEGNRSVAAVARVCGYASDASLRNALKSIARTTPADVKLEGADATVAVPFREELSKTREQKVSSARAPKSYLN